MLEDIRKQLTDAVTVLQRLNETSESKYGHETLSDV